jgi:hypothetical protein
MIYLYWYSFTKEIFRQVFALHIWLCQVSLRQWTLAVAVQEPSGSMKICGMQSKVLVAGSPAGHAPVAQSLSQTRVSWRGSSLWRPSAPFPFPPFPTRPRLPPASSPLSRPPPPPPSRSPSLTFSLHTHLLIGSIRLCVSGWSAEPRCRAESSPDLARWEGSRSNSCTMLVDFSCFHCLDSCLCYLIAIIELHILVSS